MTTALDSFLDEYAANARDAILKGDPKSTRSALDTSLFVFRRELLDACLETIKISSGDTITDSEIEELYWGFYADDASGNGFAETNLRWSLDEMGVLRLTGSLGLREELAKAALIDPRHYPLLATLALLFEDGINEYVKPEKVSADVRAALEKIADVPFRRLMRAEVARAEAQAAAEAARIGMFTVLWAQVDIDALAAGDPAAVETYLGLSEEVRFQAQLMMTYCGLDHLAFRALELDSEFRGSDWGGAGTVTRDTPETFDALMKILTSRYVEHQAYVNIPDTYLDADNADLARRRALGTDGDVLVERTLERFSNPSAGSDVTAERYAWVHTQAVAGAEPADLKDAFNSLTSPYKILLLRTAPTGDIMAMFKKILTGEV